MVKYWKSQLAVQAKVTEAKEGHYVMYLKGEKYPFPGFPRGYLLFGSLSPIKHNIKNKIFNESWALLEEGKDISQHIKDKFDEIIELAEKSRYDMLPYEKLCPAVKEIYRAWTEVEKTMPKNEKLTKIKEILTFILQEDDGYRFRVQWIARWMTYWWRKPTRKDFEFALSLLEHAEVITDMKERIRLLRRVLMEALKDKTIGTLFDRFAKEVNWKKVKLTKADKYYFRGKYFKVDYPENEY